MEKNTGCNNRKDNFTNGTFSAREWSAPTLTSPKEIQALLDSFALCGRRVKRMRIIGMSYFHTRDWVEDAAYRQLEHLPKEQREERSNYPAIDPDMLLLRYAEIDEPFLIQFEDGDVFEICIRCDPEFRMSMNCIPWEIEAGVNEPNADANIIFAPCVGREIVAIETNTYTTDKDPMFFRAFDEPPYERKFVSSIILWLDSGIGIKIEPFADYCEVSCVDSSEEYVKLPFSELKSALYNWEDLHTDDVTGFEAESHTLFFGRKGAERVEEPYMTLTSTGNAASRLHISVEDFLVLDWCISLATGTWFDEYKDYHYSCAEWFALLNEANKILSFECFDALFDELIARQGDESFMLWKLNSYGASFWKEKEKYRTQLGDLKTWSQLVLSPDDTMDISGF